MSKVWIQIVVCSAVAERTQSRVTLRNTNKCLEYIICVRKYTTERFLGIGGPTEDAP